MAHAGEVPLSDRNQYFIEIALGAEYPEAYFISRLVKWKTSVRLWVEGALPVVLREELDALVLEINTLTNRRLIEEMKDPDLANLILYWGTPDSFLEIEPEAEAMLRENDGIFRVQFDAHYYIRSGRIFLNAERLFFDFDQRHFLREELTQSLGLMQDSDRFPESIFYRKQSKVTAYSEMDQYLIRVLYDERIVPKMPMKKLIELLEAIEIENEKTIPLRE